LLRLLPPLHPPPITSGEEAASPARSARGDRVPARPSRGAGRARLRGRSAAPLHGAPARAARGDPRVPHVEVVPHRNAHSVCLPMRVDDELARALRTFAPLFVVTHFNHAKEITPEAREACARLVDYGIPGREPGGADAAGELERPGDQGPDAEVPDHARAALLPAPDGRRRRPRASAHAALPRRRDPARAARLDQRARGSAPGRRPARRRRQGDECSPTTCWRSGPGDRLSQLPRRRFSYPEPRETDCNVPYDEVFYGARQEDRRPRLPVLPDLPGPRSGRRLDPGRDLGHGLWRHRRPDWRSRVPAFRCPRR